MHPAETSAADRVTTSAWSVVSWAFFGLTTLASIGIGVYALLFRATAGDQQAGPLLGIIWLTGMGIAWQAALVCAAAGTLCAILGVLTPSRRTPSAWAALALNSIFVVVSAVLLLVLSP